MIWWEDLLIMLAMKNNVRFALYARLSREDESDNDESRSIENQRKNIKEYLTSKGFILVNEYIDDGVSGVTLNRPGFNELLNDFEQGLFDGIIVKDLSRLGRNLIEVGRFVEEFAINNNLRIISILDNYDSAINKDDDSIVLKSFVNDYYLKECKKKSRAAIQKKAEAKPLATYGLYGYNVIDGKLVINEYETQIVKYIFDEYLKGKMPKEIIDALNKSNVPGPGQALYDKCGYVTKENCNLSWKRRNVFDIVHNLSYSGTYINCKNKNCVVPSNAISIDAIVSKEIQDKAIALAKSRKVKCDEYLSHFIYNTIEKKYFKCKRPYSYFYTAKGKIVNIKGYINSKGMSFKPDEIKDIILKETKRVIKELRNNRDYISELLNGASKDNKANLSKINKDILEATNKKKKLTENYIAGIIDKESYNANKEDLSIKLKALENEKQIIEQKINNSKNDKSYKNFVDEILSYKNVDLSLARVLFKRIDVSLDEKQNKVLTFVYNI